MKEPTTHYEVEYQNYLDQDLNICDDCGSEWPCDVWKKWTRSREYRIRQLQENTDRLARENTELRTSVAALRVSVRETQMLLQHGVLRALGDAHQGKRPGHIEVEKHQDWIDVSSRLDGVRERIPGLVDYNVTYHVADGTMYVNGEFTEWSSP